MTHTEIMALAMALPPLETPPEEIPGGGCCAIGGNRIAEGYRVMDVIPKTSSEFLDTFRGDMNGWLSDATARCFASKVVLKGDGKRAGSLAAADWNLGGRIFLVAPTGATEAHHLLIPRDAAEKAGRPCWSDMVRDVWPRCQGWEAMVLLATDPKKRQWPRARAGRIGTATPVLIADGPELRSLTVNWPRLITTLDTVEDVYSAGFTKDGIRESLWREHGKALAIGAARTAALEGMIAPLRTTPEFVVAVIIAQQDAEKAAAYKEKAEAAKARQKKRTVPKTPIVEPLDNTLFS